MPQVKKDRVREAIFDAAQQLFMNAGYTQTTLAAIAKQAGTSAANIYRYYGSKLELFYAVFGPWYFDKLNNLEAQAARIEEPRARLKFVLLGVWRDLLRANGGFGGSIVEAMVFAPYEGHYSREVLETAEAHVVRLIRGCLPANRVHLADDKALGHLIYMASDGFALHSRLENAEFPVEQTAELVCKLLLHDGAA